MKAPILKPARCLYYPDSAGFELVEDYAFQIVGGGFLTVPAGFWYNGASIPAAFWQITFSPFDPRILAGALVHDWLYTSKQVQKNIADATLEKYLIDFHSGTIKAALVKKAVQLFGGFAWKDSDTDRRYVNALRARITNSGRSLTKYGL